MREKLKQPLQLCLLALVNYGLFYGLSVFLARTLDTRGFHDYSVAVATVALLVSLSTLGLEKYALRVLPANFESQDWGQARGFIRFSVRSSIVVSVVVGVVYSLVRYATSSDTVQEMWPVLIGVATVPAVALAQFLIEVLASSGKVVKATFFYRLVFPVTVVLLVIGVGSLGNGLTAAKAVMGYCVAWVGALLLLHWQARAGVPNEVWLTDVVTKPRLWLREAAPFLVHGVMMTQFASLGIIGLEFAGRGERSVALLAACMQTGSFVVLLATATNRFYSPQVSVLIEKQDLAGLKTMIRERWRWLVPVTLAYFLSMALFGRRILGLFGPEFKEAYPALMWIAGGASVSVLLAMAPNYLKFIRRNQLVLGITAAAAVVNLGLILWLGPQLGATGAAIAYAVSIGGMAIAFAAFGISSVEKQIKHP